MGRAPHISQLHCTNRNANKYCPKIERAYIAKKINCGNEIVTVALEAKIPFIKENLTLITISRIVLIGLPIFAQ